MLRIQIAKYWELDTHIQCNGKLFVSFEGGRVESSVLEALSMFLKS